MSSVRAPAVAGMFYPANPAELDTMLNGFLSAVDHYEGPAPKAVIVPHAGYIYSGPVAASAYARIASARSTITRVVLLGPSHRIPFSGLALCHADVFRTPLGDIPVDREMVHAISDLPQIHVIDAAHSQEHSLEVHLPFLQEVLDDFQLMPLVVGDATPEEVAEVLEKLWDGPETLIVISSDLSHYHDYETARMLDTETSQAIEALRPGSITHDQACGRNPVNGLLLAAHRHSLKATTVDQRNSGDTAGPRDQVVGYGSYVFE